MPSAPSPTFLRIPSRRSWDKRLARKSGRCESCAATYDRISALTDFLLSAKQFSSPINEGMLRMNSGSGRPVHISWTSPNSGLDTTSFIHRRSSSLVVDSSKASRTIEPFFWTASILHTTSSSVLVAGWSQPSWCASNVASRRSAKPAAPW